MRNYKIKNHSNNIQGKTTHQINATNLTKGTYFVTFNVNGVLTFEKIVKM
ncbi:MAG: hypothetical protein AB8G11_18950 [Saprospiraceae bacterium]